VVVCSGGSEIKPGVADSLLVTWDYMASILPPELLPLQPLLPYLAPLYIASVTDFCADEPPGYPDLTGLTVAAVLAGGEVGAGLVAAEALAQTFLNLVWYRTCQCITGTTPAPPTSPTLPDLPAINPPAIVTLPNGTGCANYAGGPVVPGFTGVVGVIGSDAHAGGTYLRLPAGVTRADINVASQAVGAVHAPAQWRFVTATSADARTLVAGSTVSSGGTFHTSVAVPAAQQDFFLDVVQASGASATTDTFTATIDFYCGGALPGQPTTPCCPPDPILSGVLAQILRAVTLIQRQAAPFGYVAGATHAGLADNGSLTISDLLGVKVEVTTLPDSYGRLSGDPIEYFGLGFLTWGTTDGYRTSTPLEHEFQVIFPPQAGVYTSLGYSLAPGVVVTVTELVREP